MDRRKKKRQPRKKDKNRYGTGRPIYPLPRRNSKEDAIKTLLKSIEEDADYIDTPFGDILIGKGMALTTIRNKNFLYEVVVDEKLDGEADTLTQLINFEKLNDKYPNEPFIRHGIALCYNELKEKDKYRAAITEDFEYFNREDPNIDAAYLQLMVELKNKELASSLVGEELNMHQLYPKLKVFDEETVESFYTVMAEIFVYRKDFETAEKCAKIVSSISPKAGFFINTMIEYESDPRKRRKARILTILLILTILAVIVGIIWGIIKFFQWIF